MKWTNNKVTNMDNLKTYTYKVTNYDGQELTGFVVAERKLSASFLIAQRMKDAGYIDFKVTDIKIK